MIVTFRKPVEGLRGKIRLEDGFYIRKLHGKYVVQRCPKRKGHVPTEKERENRQRFIQQYRRLRRDDGSQASGSVADGRGSGLEVKGGAEWREMVVEKPPEKYVPKFYKYCTIILWIILAAGIVYIATKWYIKLRT